MYAVIQTGGKQYRVAPGDTIRIERVEGKVGEKVNFGNVLAVHGDKKLFVGAEAEKATVTAKFVDERPRFARAKAGREALRRAAGERGHDSGAAARHQASAGRECWARQRRHAVRHGDGLCEVSRPGTAGAVHQHPAG